MSRSMLHYVSTATNGTCMRVLQLWTPLPETKSHNMRVPCLIYSSWWSRSGKTSSVQESNRQVILCLVVFKRITSLSCWMIPSLTNFHFQKCQRNNANPIHTCRYLPWWIVGIHFAWIRMNIWCVKHHYSEFGCKSVVFLWETNHSYMYLGVLPSIYSAIQRCWKAPSKQPCTLKKIDLMIWSLWLVQEAGLNPSHWEAWKDTKRDLKKQQTFLETSLLKVPLLVVKCLQESQRTSINNNGAAEITNK